MIRLLPSLRINATYRWQDTCTRYRATQVRDAAAAAAAITYLKIHVYNVWHLGSCLPSTVIPARLFLRCNIWLRTRNIPIRPLYVRPCTQQGYHMMKLLIAPCLQRRKTKHMSRGSTTA